jgi:phosphoribosylaminoimidazolecarboxamide formyltransferase/IMP cyclohydrolase
VPASGEASRLLVLVSGSGTNLQALIEAAADPSYGAQIVAVGADRAGAGGLQRAEAAGIPTFVVPLSSGVERAAWDEALADEISAYRPDLVVAAGFMRILGTAVLDRWPVVNTHPALLPSFPGAHAVRDALAYGVKVTGATVHLVDTGVDTGPVIAQVAVPVEDGDDEESLHERIKERERTLLVDVVGSMARDGWTTTGRKVTLNVSTRPIRRALVSVYDKTGLEELGRALQDAGVAIVSTGSTAGRLREAGVTVTAVEELTGFPECLDGRVKTLHPRVHAGILADLRLEAHRKQLAELGVEPFDLVVVNLYPFRETVASGAAADEVVEQIDIGGPSMVRAAAKNHPSVAVVVDPARYPQVIAAVRGEGFTLPERRTLAAEAFAHTASYDIAVASWFASGYAADEVASESGFPGWLGGDYVRADVLRYGENPHQQAALYRRPDVVDGLAQAEQLHGKPMSYNNYVDTDAALRAANDFSEPCVAIIKHANPCGIAVGADVAEAHRKAHACDPTSAFGGVIAVNRPVTVAMAQQVADIFTEVVVAPDFEPAAVEVLARKPSIRLLRTRGFGGRGQELRQICGGLLLQSADSMSAPGDDPSAWTLVSGAAADAATLADLAFAWRAVRAVKSNAILLAADGATVGVGMGQVNRVDSSRLAVARAGERAAGAVAASDAFFPFPDGLEVLLEAGVRAVVQPGGSVRDDLSIKAAADAGATMYLTGTRHFFH